MTLGLAFWILMLLWLVLGFWWAWPVGAAVTVHAWFPVGGTILIFALFFIVGWQIFGPPIHR